MRRLAIPTPCRLLIIGTIASTRFFLDRVPFSVLGQPDEGLLLAAAMALGELLGMLELDRHHVYSELHRQAVEMRRLREQEELQAKKRAKVLKMLFPEGSAIAAGVVAELVPPEMIAEGLSFDALSFEKCIGEGAFSRVYGATFEGRAVAVKQLSRDRASLDVVS